MLYSIIAFLFIFTLLGSAMSAAAEQRQGPHAAQQSTASPIAQPTGNAVYLPLLARPNASATPQPTPTSQPGSGSDTLLTTTVAPNTGDTFAKAEFSLWVPKEATTVRGLLIYAPGCGASSLTPNPSPERAAFARKWQLGFLGMNFTDGKDFCGWSDADYGSAKALERGLQAFSQQSKRTDIVNAPWVIFGVSGGSGWANRMAALYPSRTIAVYARGFGPKAITAEMRDIPILLNGKSGAYGTAGAFKTCRAQGGLCGLNIDKTAEPPLSKQWSRMAIPFFDAVLTQRLPASATPGAPTTLLPPEPSRVWFGNPTTFEIAPESSYSANKAEASWLPDEAMAKRWQAYNTTGELPAAIE
jgi:pimeloyl-ACP methyl ester carboxylesterase